MRLQDVKKKIYEVTGYPVKGDAYALQTFTRSSVSGGENNEIFEMYGDAVLACYAMQLIHERLGGFRNEDSVNFKGDNGYALRGIRNESELNEVKKKLVCNETLAKQIDKWGLAKYLIMSSSDEKNGVREQTKTKADLFEAILGLVAVTYNFNSEVLKEVVKKMLPIDEIVSEIVRQVMPPVDFTVDNAVTKLKELSEQGFCSAPEYEYGNPDALDYYENGDPMWSCMCTVWNRGFRQVVFANSKKTAKKVVSYIALCKFFEITNPIAQYKAINNASVFEKDGKFLIVEGFHKAPKEEDWNNSIKL